MPTYLSFLYNIFPLRGYSYSIRMGKSGNYIVSLAGGDCILKIDPWDTTGESYILEYNGDYIAMGKYHDPDWDNDLLKEAMGYNARYNPEAEYILG